MYHMQDYYTVIHILNYTDICVYTIPQKLDHFMYYTSQIHINYAHKSSTWDSTRRRDSSDVGLRVSPVPHGPHLV